MTHSTLEHGFKELSALFSVPVLRQTLPMKSVPMPARVMSYDQWNGTIGSR
jgi:hypothetical protein